MGFGDAFDYASARRSSRRSGGSRTRRPATTCAASATSGCAQTPAAVAVRRPTTATTATRSATSTTASARTCSIDADGHRPRLAFPPPSRTGGVLTPARTWTPHELPDDDYPFVLNTGRLQHQWHTMTKTGRVAKLNKLDPGPFVEIHPDDAARAGHRRRRTRRGRLAARPRGAARRGDRPGAARATASRRSTGTTSTAST